MAACQVRTLWEKEVREEPWAVVEKTGCRRIPLRKRFMEGEVDERKKERWDVRAGLRILDSKLPGSMIEGDGGGEGVAAALSSIEPCEGGDGPFCRLWEKSRFLLKRRCSKSGVNGSKR